MTIATPPSPRLSPVAKFENGAAWWHALGDVPLERIVMDPPPGTATEQDLIIFVERDKRLCELINGTLVEKPVTFYESFVATRLSTLLSNHAMPRRLGIVLGADAMMRLVPGQVRLPDVSFVSIQRLPGGQVPREPIPSIAPDLAVEVLSPSNTRAEMRQKLAEYFESGTRLVWLIDPPSKTVAVYEGAVAPARTLSESDTLDGGTVLPGFTLVIAELFAQLP